MSKLSKLVNKPELFFRDYFLKKAPLSDKERRALLPESVAKTKTSVSKHRDVSKANRDALSQVIEDIYPITFPIDVVYTWVNADDSEFNETRLYHQNKINGSSAETIKNESTDIARFESRDELKYSIRSIFKYAPWVNHIYIVTNGQIPAWLNKNCDKVTVISHSQILEEKYLPTFNSHVIESALHKIPNLSEHFIYFNDDVMLTRPLPPSYFFTSSGMAKLFMTGAMLPNGEKNSNDSPTQWAAKNSRKLLLEKTGFWAETMFAHTFHPQLKSIHEEINRLWSKELSQCRKNKFRADSDLTVATFLHHHLALIRGKALATRTKCMYFNIRDKKSEKFYASLLANKDTDGATHSICLNDKLSSATNVLDDFDDKLLAFLNAYYPEASEAEIVPPTKKQLMTLAGERRFVDIYELIQKIYPHGLGAIDQESYYLYYYFGLSSWFIYQDSQQSDVLQQSHQYLQSFCEKNPHHKLAQEYLEKATIALLESSKVSK